MKKLAYPLIFTILFACSPSDDLPQEDIQDVLSVRDQLAVDFSKTLANALKETAVRKFIQTESSKKFDEQHKIVFQLAKDTEVTTIKNARGESMTFSDVLFGSSESLRADAQDPIDPVFLEQLELQYPTLEISLPQLDEDSSMWDGSYEPKVAVVPEDFDEATHDFIMAYDSDGNEYSISTVDEPDEMVVIVGPSESVIAMPKNLGVARQDDVVDCVLGEPILSLQVVDIYSSDDIAIPCGGGGGGSGSSIDDDSEETCNVLQMTGLKFGAGKLKYVESWVSGRPEIIGVFYYNIAENYNDGYWSHDEDPEYFTFAGWKGEWKPKKRRDISGSWFNKHERLMQYPERKYKWIWFFERDIVGGFGTLASACPLTCADDCEGNGPTEFRHYNCTFERNDDIGSLGPLNRHGHENLSIDNCDEVFEYTTDEVHGRSADEDEELMKVRLRRIDVY